MTASPDHTTAPPREAEYQRIAADLAYRDAGTLTGRQATAAVTAARAVLEPQSRIRDFLPVLVERNARDQLLADAQAAGRAVTPVPELLFVCVHNAGRSQMAAALDEHLSGGRVHVRSAGSAPTGQILPTAVQALAERGITLDPGLPQAADRLRPGRRRRHSHHGLRRHLPRPARQALPGLERRRPGQATHRHGPPDPRRPPDPGHRPAR